MTDNGVTREGYLKQWEQYGYQPEEVRELMEQRRITSKSVFSNFFHWYIDEKLMFAEYIDDNGNYKYIAYRKKGDEKDVY